MSTQPAKWSPPAVVKPVDSDLVPMQVGGRTLSVEELVILKGNLAPNALNAEFLFFILYCERFTLDPFGDAYLITRKDKNSPRGEKSIIQLGINAYRKRAIESGAYEGRDGPYWKRKGEDWVDIWEYEEENPFAARVKVYRTGCRVPFVGTALWRAYGAGATNTTIWNQFNADQLAKVAEKKALEAGFTQLSHAYIDEEMRQMGERVEVSIQHVDGETIEGTLEPPLPQTVSPRPVEVTSTPPAPSFVESVPTVVEEQAAPPPSLLIGQEDIEALTNMYYFLGETDWYLFLAAAGVRADAIEGYTPEECQTLYNAWEGFLASKMTAWQTSAISGLATKIKGWYPHQLTDASLKKFRLLLLGDGRLTVMMANQLFGVYAEMELVLSLALTPTTEGIIDEDLTHLRELMAPVGNVLEMWLPAFAAQHDEYLVWLYQTLIPEMIPDEGLRARFVAARDALGLAPAEEVAVF